jgi:hypothetical protein
MYLRDKKHNEILPTNFNVGFGVLTTVVIESSVLWDIMPCSPLKVNQHFRGKCYLHLQGQTVSQATSKLPALGWLLA